MDTRWSQDHWPSVKHLVAHSFWILPFHLSPSCPRLDKPQMAKTADHPGASPPIPHSQRIVGNTLERDLCSNKYLLLAHLRIVFLDPVLDFRLHFIFLLNKLKIQLVID